ncbi:MAG: adenylate/guanylate cyclase domain-containing protein [Thermodesulfovibrionales bacterium]
MTKVNKIFKRRHKRFNKTFKTIFSLKGNNYTGNLCNLSKSGIFISTRNCLPVGTTIDIELLLPDGNISLLKGEVRRVIKSKFIHKNGMGIELIKKDSTYSNLLKSLDRVEKNVLILFADIRGFTTLSENLLPYDVVHLLNRYFHMMNKVIIQHGGKINNYMGDGFMAIFDVKNEEKDLLSGIKAGLEMLNTVNNHLRPYTQKFFKSDFKIGIGLHYGMVVVGTIGSGDNKRETIIGNAVNFASHIESINKLLGTEFLISENIYKLIHNKIKVRKIQKISIQGIAGLQTLYEVLGLS